MPIDHRALLVALAGMAAAGAITAVLVAPDPATRLSETVILLVVVAFLMVGLIVEWTKPDHWVGRWTLGGALALGVGEGLVAVGSLGAPVPPSGWQALTLALGSATRELGWLALAGLVPMVFPDGRVHGSRGRRLWSKSVAWAAAVLIVIPSLGAPFAVVNEFAGMPSPWGFTHTVDVALGALAGTGMLLILVTMVTSAAGLQARWRSGDDLIRQQLLWITLAFLAPVGLVVGLMIRPIDGSWAFGIALLPIPVAIAVSMLQHRLFDVQLVASRSLTWISLSTSLALLYAVTVGGVGALLRDRGGDWLPWLAAGAVAVSFAPLRNILQMGINQLVYGGWAEPASVLASSGRRLADATDVPTLLGTILADLGDGLGLSFAAVVDTAGAPLATFGTETHDAQHLRLNAFGVGVGTLTIAGHRLRDSDRRLLADLARQIGGVVHSHKLNEELRVAQGHLIEAIESERKRLRRDLHDGLGPALASLGLQVDTIRNRSASGQQDLDGHLLALRGGIQATVLDVRRIVEGLRPPSLDELGLMGALEVLAEQMARADGLEISMICTPIDDFPAAVEVAAYRIIQEALGNAVKHSGATEIAVEIVRAQSQLSIGIRDNGLGVIVPRRGGFGLQNMRFRALELGGTFEVKAIPEVGTTVGVVLPLDPDVETE